MNDKLRGKLAEWAGFQWLEATDGNYHWFDANGDIVSPTDEDGNVIWDMNACFKWLVPELLWFRVLFDHVEVSCDYYVTLTDFYLAQPCREYEAQDKDPALALCLALEKLIDGGE